MWMNVSETPLTSSTENLIGEIGCHINTKLISDVYQQTSLDDESKQIIEQMIQDRKLFEEVKDLHKNFKGKQQYSMTQTTATTTNVRSTDSQGEDNMNNRENQRSNELTPHSRINQSLLHPNIIFYGSIFFFVLLVFNIFQAFSSFMRNKHQ